MSDAIGSMKALESVIGKTPPAIGLKVIDHVDATARRWLAAAPLMFAGLGDLTHLSVTLGGGAAGFVQAPEPGVLELSMDDVDDPALFVADASFGSLFLIPGIGETLRINGRVAAVADDRARIAIDECYVHCAKALIRSEFWGAGAQADAPDDHRAFAAASRFIALATIDADGGADLSPKGDPAGTMAGVEGDRLWFADRPGNRRVDSFRNIIAQPRVAAALLIPGSTAVMIVDGRAAVTTDAAMREAFAVRGKTPLLVTRIDTVRMVRRESAALARAALWPAAAAPADIRPAKMFAEHIRLNKDKGLGARIAGAFVSVPGLMQRGLDKDYKDNLY